MVGGGGWGGSEIVASTVLHSSRPLNMEATFFFRRQVVRRKTLATHLLGLDARVVPRFDLGITYRKSVVMSAAPRPDLRGRRGSAGIAPT